MRLGVVYFLWFETNLGLAIYPDLSTEIFKGVLCKVQYTLAFVCELVYFSWSFMGHVPRAFHVAFFLQHRQQGIDGAGAKIDAEGFADRGDYLIAMHGMSSQ
jgi:hypothetical protein